MLVVYSSMFIHVCAFMCTVYVVFLMQAIDLNVCTVYMCVLYSPSPHHCRPIFASLLAMFTNIAVHGTAHTHTQLCICECVDRPFFV